MKVASSIGFFIGGKLYKAPERTTLDIKPPIETNNVPNGDYDVNFKHKKPYDNMAYLSSEAPPSTSNNDVVLSTHI